MLHEDSPKTKDLKLKTRSLQEVSLKHGVHFQLKKSNLSSMTFSSDVF